MEKYLTSIPGGRQPAPHPHEVDRATPDSPSREGPAPSRPVLETDAALACNRLVAVLLDAANGWRVAADGVDDHALATHMQELAGRREEFAAALDNIIASMSKSVGVERNTRTQLLAWRLEARAATSHGDKAAILRVCRLGNRAIIKEYGDALRVTMPNSLSDMIAQQANEVRRTGDWLASIG